MLPILLAPAPSYCLSLVNENIIPKAVAKVTIQKKRSPKVEAKLVGSFTISKFAFNTSQIVLLPQCESPTAVKAIPRIIIKSVNVGFLVTLSA